METIDLAEIVEVMAVAGEGVETIDLAEIVEVMAVSALARDAVRIYTAKGKILEALEM